jgi:hypothetical protein
MSAGFTGAFVASLAVAASVAATPFTSVQNAIAPADKEIRAASKAG